MFVQNSYRDEVQGKLYLVPTPIGNLEDITYRALDTLKKVDIIIAEDTRHTQKLLHYFDIQNELLSYHEHNEKERVPQIISYLLEGKQIALVSDAGMPAISDPGYEIVCAAVEKKMPVIPLPGPNAATTALVASGLSTSQFYFYGFLPRKTKEKNEAFAFLQKLPTTFILYESPYRVKDTLRILEKELGNRQIVLARELTKIYEQFVRGSVRELLTWLENNDIKGECCIIVQGNEEGEWVENEVWWEQLSIEEHVQMYEEKEDMTNKEAMKKVAKDRNISRRDVYKQLHVK